MEKLAELFNSILFFSVAYPATLFNALVFPKKVYGPKKAFLTCPAGITLAISFFLAYGAGTVIDRIRFPGVLSVRLPNEEQSVAVLISITPVLLLALGLIRSFRLHPTEHTPIEEMLTLSYPISVFLATRALVLAFCLAVPDFAISVAPVLFNKSDWIQLYGEGSRAVKFEGAVDAFSIYPMFLLPCVALFNVLRAVYRANWKKSIAATATIFVCAFLLLMGVLFGLERLESNIQSLEEKPQKTQIGNPDW